MAKLEQLDLFNRNVLGRGNGRTGGWVRAGTIAEGLLVKLAQHCNIPRDWIVDDVKNKMKEGNGQFVLDAAKKIFEERKDPVGLKQIQEIESAHMH